MTPLQKTIRRIENGMSPEAAIGLEWRLMREDEGFNGITWTHYSTNTGMAKKSSDFMVRLIKAIGDKRVWSSTLYSEIGGDKKRVRHYIMRLEAMHCLRIVKRDTSSGLLLELTDDAEDFLIENDVQGALF